MTMINAYLRSEVAIMLPSSCSSMTVSVSLTISSTWSTILQTREGAGKEGADSQWSRIGEETEAEVGADTDTDSGRSGNDCDY